MGGVYRNVQYYNLDGWTHRRTPKNYSVIFSFRSKKIVIGQSQNAKNSCFKSILANPHFGHLWAVLRSVAIYATFSSLSQMGRVCPERGR